MTEFNDELDLDIMGEVRSNHAENEEVKSITDSTGNTSVNDNRGTGIGIASGAPSNLLEQEIMKMFSTSSIGSMGLAGLMTDPSKLMEIQNFVNQNKDGLASLMQQRMGFDPSAMPIPSMNSNEGHLSIPQPQAMFNPMMMTGPIISWREEAIKGNFMPAVLMLERRQINIEEIVNPQTGDKLIHLAVTFSYLNVTRCLVEKFKANVNSRNMQGHSPLHIVANNTTKDLFLLCYLLNLEDLELDALDKTKVTPLFYATMNNFNEAVIAIASKNCDLDHIDGFKNSVIYLTVHYGNKFCFRFIQTHAKNFDINQTFFGNDTTLSDILINSKHTNICKYVMKHHHSLLNTKSILNKQVSTFKFLNYFNYELIKTTYCYQSYGALCGLIYFLSILRNFRYKTYMLSFMLYDLIMLNMNMLFRIALIYGVISYNIYVCYDYHVEFSGDQPSLSSIEELMNLKSLVLLYQIMAVVSGIVSLLKFTLIWVLRCCYYFEKDHIKKELLYSDDSRCVIQKIKRSVETDPLAMPMISGYCEVCLVSKEKDSAHCSTCKTCVKGYHFHSKVLGICISKSTVMPYVMLLNALTIIFGYSIYYMYKLTDSRSTEVSRNGIASIYKSDYLMFNIVIFVTRLCAQDLLYLIFLFGSTLYFTQITLAILVSFGYRSTYYFLWKLHKPINLSLLKLREGKKSTCAVPPGPSIPITQFISNMFCASDS